MTPAAAQPAETAHLSLAQRGVIGAIRLYQRTLSPDHGPLGQHSFIGCRYYPSCSEYTARSVARRGVAGGLIKSSWRILRCNPFTPGGVDESY